MTHIQKNMLLFITFITVLLIAVTVWALSETQGHDTEIAMDGTTVPEKILDDEDDLQAMFREADVIPDGKLDAGEFDIHHLTVFQILDANQDGRLEKDECTLDCFTYQILKNRDRTHEEPIRRLEFEQTPYRFDAIDIDDSGDLVVYEYILFGRERFPFFDRNKNNFIENAEFCSGYRSSMPCDYSDKEILP